MNTLTMFFHPGPILSNYFLKFSGFSVSALRSLRRLGSPLPSAVTRVVTRLLTRLASSIHHDVAMYVVFSASSNCFRECTSAVTRSLNLLVGLDKQRLLSETLFRIKCHYSSTQKISSALSHRNRCSTQKKTIFQQKWWSALRLYTINDTTNPSLPCLRLMLPDGFLKSDKVQTIWKSDKTESEYSCT